MKLKKSLMNTILIVGIFISKISSKCISITHSKSCPNFNGYSFDTDNGVFPLLTEPKYTDLKSFDLYIEKYAEFLAKRFSKDLAIRSTCDVQEMENYAISNLRYLKTYACNFILNSKENKCEKPEKKVCKSVCTDFVSSYQGLINKYNDCLNQQFVSRNIYIQNSRCTNTKSNFSATSNCVDQTNETNCGFSSVAQAQKFCRISRDEACCKSIVGDVTDANLADTQNTCNELKIKLDNVLENYEFNCHTDRYTGIYDFLFLYNNQLEKIPKEMVYLMKLETLNLNNNKLIEIPKEIGNMIKLRFLYLNDNNITEIPKEIKYIPNLQKIEIDNNCLISIPEKVLINKLIGIYIINNNSEKCPTYGKYYGKVAGGKYDTCKTKEYCSSELGCLSELGDYLNICGKGIKCPAGQCCSKFGECGKTAEFCSTSNGCQSEFGVCKCGDGFGNCPEGQCCSKYGECGKTAEFCSISNGCQSEFGNCKCGHGFGQCSEGQCCSGKGYCGYTAEYCLSSNGCQPKFGKCKCGGNLFNNCNNDMPIGKKHYKHYCCGHSGYCGTAFEDCAFECANHIDKCIIRYISLGIYKVLSIYTHIKLIIMTIIYIFIIYVIYKIMKI